MKTVDAVVWRSLAFNSTVVLGGGASGAVRTRSVCWLLCYCCDTTPQPRQLREESVYLGLTVPAHNGAHNGGAEVAGGRQLEQQPRTHISKGK